MKILAVIGSPKGKGNSYKIVQRIEERMKNPGNIEFEYLFLKDTGLAMCKGCSLCLNKGEDKCPLKDSRAAIERQMLEADGVILASPTYVLNVSALMKNLFDRMAYVSHRPRFFKPVLVVSTTGALGAGFTSFMLGMMASSWGFDVVSKVSALTPYDGERYLQKDMGKYNRKLEKSLDKAAGKFYAALLQGRRQPGVFAIAQFLLRRRSFLKEAEDNVDRIYFEQNGWLRNDALYFYEIRAGVVKKGLARGITAILGKFA